MCIIAVAINQHPKFPIIIINNRDEYVSRICPVEKNGNGIICGTDTRCMGTWGGFNTNNGNFVNLTNIGDFKGHGSRGILVADLLMDLSEVNLDANFNKVDPKGYNVMYGNLFTDDPELYVYSSRSGDGESVLLGTGIHGIGNDVFGDEFYKVGYLNNKLDEFLRENQHVTSIKELQRGLASLLCHKQASVFSVEFWVKFFKWNDWHKKPPRRRRQPGLTWYFIFQIFFLVIFFLLAITLSGLFTGWGFSLKFNVYLPLALSFILSFYLGVSTHFEMNQIFITLKPFLWPFVVRNWFYGTLTQTIVLVDDESVYYACRETKWWDGKSKSSKKKRRRGKGLRMGKIVSWRIKRPLFNF